MRRLACILTFLVIAAAIDPAASAFKRLQRVVYIGTYTGEMSKGIYAFRFDDTSGQLTPIGLVAETPSPSFLTASSDGRFVFAVNELQTYADAPGGSVTSFAVDPETAKLTELSVQPSKGAGPCHLILDRTGRHLAVANYGGGNYALFPVGSDGRLQPPTAVVDGLAGEAAGAKPLGHAVGFDASNRFLVTADKGLNRHARLSVRCRKRTAEAQRSGLDGAAAEVGTAAFRVSSERALGVHDQPSRRRPSRPSHGMRSRAP